MSGARSARSAANEADPAEELVELWFADATESGAALDAQCRMWFDGSSGVDAWLRQRFGHLLERADRGELRAWTERPRSCLALVIALDQLPRHLFRGMPRAFAYDAMALEVARSALERRFDRSLHPVQAAFLYLPLEHAEDPAMQDRSVQLFRSLVARGEPEIRPTLELFASYAERHRAVIQRFGRFPHRNRLLGRRPTGAEERYLADGGETFAGPGDSD